MKNKNIILYIILITVICIVVSFLFVEITKLYLLTTNNKEYKKLGLEIEEYDIEYCTVYTEDFLDGKYKVYKLKNYSTHSMDEFRTQLERSDLWNKNKYYEYIMKEFSEIKDEDTILIDREDLYYYNGKNAYAIFDLKNAKLYYYINRVFNHHVDYPKDLNLNIRNYISREIYDVRGGPQNDGRDYYVYKFTEEKGRDIIEELEQNQKWSKNRLDDDKLENFEYNKEVLNIKNGYYYYELVCRTRDENKKKNVIKENATGYEIAVYDADENILYYYWESI